MFSPLKGQKVFKKFSELENERFQLTPIYMLNP